MTPTNEAGHGLPELPLHMDTAPRDGTMVRLLVQFEDHATEDTDGPAWTIGACNDDNVGDDERVGWQFAGWCWSHDHFTEGRGTPVGWLPMTARDALALSRGVPADMVLVPVEPTAAMCDAMRISVGDGIAMKPVYRAMLAAAPAAAGAQGEEYAACCDTPAYCSSVRRCTRMDTTPQPAAADGGVRERARELLAEVYRDSGYLYEAGTLEAGVVDSIDDCALRAIEKALTKPILPSVKTFASAVWRDWMTSEQADKLGAELHAWLSAHFATALSSHRQAGDGLSKFRELAEGWKEHAKKTRQEAEEETSEVMYYANRHEAAAYSGCAYALLALVEKGAGS